MAKARIAAALLAGACWRRLAGAMAHRSRRRDPRPPIGVAAIAAEEEQWNRDFAAHDVERLVGHYAPDATLKISGVPPLTGSWVRRSVEAAVNDRALAMSFAHDRIEVARSGDLGYSRGHYRLTQTDRRTGQPVTEYGTYLTVWQRQADGRWKALEDFDTPGPAAQAADVTDVISPTVWLRYASTAAAHSRPSRIAQTTSDWPRRMSPQAKMPSRSVAVADVPRHRRPPPCRRCLRRRSRGSPWRAGRDRPSSSNGRSRPGVADEPRHLPVLALEMGGDDRECALGALLLRRGGAQLHRPERPAQRLVLAQRRLGHDLELGDRGGALAVRGADAVRAGVAAADHDDMLARREDRPIGLRRACVAPVRLRSENPSRNGCRRARGPALRGRAAARRRRPAPARNNRPSAARPGR